MAGNMAKGGFVYILTNKNNTTLYTGVTNDLKKRVHQHREKLVDGFSKKFNLTRLVYYEMAETIVAAIEREKQIKNYSRAKKIGLVQGMNDGWKDLYESL